jgi:tRNA pseudouridine38-40 synthase
MRDFGAFVPANLRGARTRTMYRAEFRREGDLVIVELEASGFMRQMVRAIVGTLIWVGLGQIDEAKFGRIVLAGDRRSAAQTAPAHGLYLVSVQYPDDKDPSSLSGVVDGQRMQGSSPRNSKEKA